MPMSSSVDPTAEFEPGVFGQLKLIGNDIVIGVSDGTAPLGIIDDVRATAFTKAQVDEVILIDGGTSEVDGNGDLVNTNDVVGILEFPSIIESSFTSTSSVVLNSVNGVVTVPAGTELNYDSDDDGINDSFKVIANYIYRIANKPGDDSTIGSGRVTVHYQRGIYDNEGVFTGMVQPDSGYFPKREFVEIAYVTGPPSASNGTIELMLL